MQKQRKISSVFYYNTLYEKKPKLKVDPIMYQLLQNFNIYTIKKIFKSEHYFINYSISNTIRIINKFMLRYIA